MLKSWPMIGMVIGSSIGGYLPLMLGADILSMWTIVGTLIGGVLGIWLGLKMPTTE